MILCPLLSAAVDAGMVEALTAKVTAWEDERGNEFLYDGVSVYTDQLSVLHNYQISIFTKKHVKISGPSFINA